jgi:ABC-type glutathione transport system ATPase component
VTFHYPARGGREPPPVVDDVSLEVHAGECVGLIGESGSGKSTIARLAAGLLGATRGEVRLFDQTVAARRPLEFRRRLQIVFQDPFSSLDPTFTVGQVIGEGLAIHGRATGARTAAVEASLTDVALHSGFARRRPHELSGGQRQRVAIARALAVEPDILVLDEPTSALDLMVQAQVLNLLLAAQARRRLAFLLISHDLDVVRHMAHRVYVMERGRIVESGEASTVLSAPAHPYTRSLLAAAPRIGTEA